MVYPKISIVIPAKPEEPVITLDYIKKADYPKEKLEVFVVRGTAPSRQRNEALRKATGKIICFLDSDSTFSPDYFKKVVENLKDKKFKVVGGPAKASSTNKFLQKCFSYTLSSYFATQKMQAKFDSVGKLREATEKELILCNLAIEKKILDQFGGFDEKLYPNEENELLNRINGNGIKFLYDPNMPIFRSSRPTLFAFMKQLFNYGRGRTEHFIVRPFFQPLFFIPAIFNFYLLSLIFYHPLIYLLPLFIYLSLDLIFSLGISIKKESLSIFVLPFLFPLVHISYGIGSVYGLIHKKKKNIEPVKVNKVSLLNSNNSTKA